jgi:hypothetical protein
LPVSIVIVVLVDDMIAFSSLAFCAPAWEGSSASDLSVGIMAGSYKWLDIR